MNDTLLIANPELLTKSISNLYVSGNIFAKWIFSYTDYLLAGLIVGLIIWNIWITYKLKKYLEEI